MAKKATPAAPKKAAKKVTPAEEPKAPAKKALSKKLQAERLAIKKNSNGITRLLALQKFDKKHKPK